MSQPNTGHKHGNITILNVLCSNSFIVQNGNTDRYSVEPNFSESDGIAGLLIAELKPTMGNAICKVGANTLRKKASPYDIFGDTIVRTEGGKVTVRLRELELARHRFAGRFNIRFCGVTSDQIPAFNFESYVINCQLIVVEAISDLHAYVQA
jgi:hypothetical protein